MYTSSTERRTLGRTGDERGVAIASEYMLLLGVSILIFTAVFIGFSSFGNTASADARSAAAYRVAVQVSWRISAAALADGPVSESIDIPGRICGSPYIVYPSGDGKAIRVLVDGEEREAPVIGDVKIEGFMTSLPAGHRIDYEPSSGTAVLA